MIISHVCVFWTLTPDITKGNNENNINNNSLLSENNRSKVLEKGGALLVGQCWGYGHDVIENLKIARKWYGD